ncbi:MAG: tetratricopeptide repeat protein [Acidobacteriota bacterium]
MKAEVRHKMKQDEFVSLFSRVTSAVADNPRQTITALAIVLALVALFFGAAAYRRAQMNKANMLFQQGMNSYYGQRLDVPPPSKDAKPSPDYRAALAKFKEVSGYRLTPLREPARLMTAVCEAKLNRQNEAKAALDGLSKGAQDSFYGRMARFLLADALYQAGKYAEAARAYAELSQTNDPNFPTDCALLAAGMSQDRAGDRAAAVATFKKLKIQYPLSSCASTADEEIRRLAPDQAEQ